MFYRHQGIIGILLAILGAAFVADEYKGKITSESWKQRTDNDRASDARDLNRRISKLERSRKKLVSEEESCHEE